MSFHLSADELDIILAYRKMLCLSEWGTLTVTKVKGEHVQAVPAPVMKEFELTRLREDVKT